MLRRHARVLLFARARADDARLDVEPVEQPLAEPNPESRRSELPRLHASSPAELRAIGSRSDQHARGLAAFDHPLQPQPGRERQPPDGVGRRLGDIEHDEAEVAGLQHERERADRLLDRALIELAAQPLDW